ncbi:hypothetical protein Pmar_PMAR006138 [Perkinsus marinus ATCC 50983]|uniref:Uncharacterized protein n=1 Tax=Perkinsus marinus (strain ATCC 50983 / TXsc) TaxID=423536 RepID=C5LAB4_PERM5|nr:hypothetical protein Pmar_PMAR006138 [Perkinsus marinus ATCC 50983]EER06370.1 hypothetical protein Pmar_PMAR006138 [Perkinsus marinus ATCC 50983]|eukprot:XP_002774554.1 hypothetical protein Pmar_PMAR006138 [Perkinsus marinus ATCC 50983]
MGLSARFPSLDAEPLPPPPSPVGSPEGVAGAGPSSPSWPPPPEEAYGPPYKPVEVYEYLLRRQDFYCRIVHPFTTIDYTDVMYEMVLKDDEVKLYYTALTKSGGNK